MLGNDPSIAPGLPIAAGVLQQTNAAIRAGRLIAGPGVRLQTDPNGTRISFDGRQALWAHPFRVTLSAAGASVRPGLVNGVEPLVGKVPLSGGPDGIAPQLGWAKPKLDKTGRGWIALEVTCGPLWEILEARIVQVASLDSEDAPGPAAPGYSAGGVPGLSGRRARHPLAMLRSRSSGALAVFQITHFNLQHRVKVAGGSTDQARHFFFPAG